MWLVLLQFFVIFVSMRNTGIYKISNNTNSKIYIGSSININRRWNSHKNALLKNKHKNILLQNHVNKYGIENIVFEIIEICSKDNLINREQFYIDLLKPIFNICKIAGNTLGYRYSIEQKDKLSLSQAYKVYQYTLEGNYLKGWNSTREVAKYYNCSYSGINKCCVGTFNSFIGYIWKYEKLYSVATYKNNHLKEVEQYDLEFKLVNSFYTIKEAGKFMKVCPNFISRICKNKRGTCKGYYFKYKETSLEDLIINNTNKVVYIFDKDKNLIFKSTDKKEIIKKFNYLKMSAVSRHLNSKKDKMYKNLYFSYENII